MADERVISPVRLLQFANVPSGMTVMFFKRSPIVVRFAHSLKALSPMLDAVPPIDFRPVQFSKA